MPAAVKRTALPGALGPRPAGLAPTCAVIAHAVPAAVARARGALAARATVALVA